MVARTGITDIYVGAKKLYVDEVLDVLSATVRFTGSTISGGTFTDQTLTSPVLTTPQINDTSADHQYVFAVSELSADRTITLPLLTGNDTFVFAAHTQTLTNKTLTSPTISGGTINNAVIGGTTAAAITGTTITATTSFDLPATGFLRWGSSLPILDDNGTSGLDLKLAANQPFLIRDSGNTVRFSKSVNQNILIGGTADPASAVAALGMSTGTAPTGGLTDGFVQYSADQTAGNAAPHFRTENGSIIILFEGAALTAADASAVNSGDATTDTVIGNIRTRLGELEDRLQAHGLLA